MTINSAFLGHGVFCYQPLEVKTHFAHYPLPGGSGTPAPSNGYAGAIAAFKDMGIANVWVRLFGHEGPMPVDDAVPLVAALREAGIGVAGWGYSHGNHWKADLEIADKHSQILGLKAFVTDIEPGRKLDGTVSKWKAEELNEFVDGLVARFGKENIGVSTWPVLKIQTSHGIPTLGLMKSIAGKVAFFAPQAYWMTYPTTVHYNATGFSEQAFPRNDPASFVRLVLRSWRTDGFTNPIYITGQAYWGEGGPSQSTLEKKISDFASGFTDWSELIGLSWWHAGGPRAMSMSMVGAIKAADFSSKPFDDGATPVS